MKAPGCFVKISNKRERFFVKVTKVLLDGTVQGVISNYLVCPAEYMYGDFVEFQKRNVLEIQASKLLHQQFKNMSFIESMLLQSLVTLTPSNVNSPNKFKDNEKN